MPFIPVVDFSSTLAFLGIPYAQPPTGNRRLRKPQSLEKGFDGGKYEAKEYSVFVSRFSRDVWFEPDGRLLFLQCPGFGADDWPYELGEDCLTINVVRPAGTTEDSNLPVGFWIYGGGYQQGGSGDRRCTFTFPFRFRLRELRLTRALLFSQTTVHGSFSDP